MCRSREINRKIDIQTPSSPPQVPDEMNARALRLHLPDRAIALPTECACCGEAASVRSALAAPNGRELLVGYCEPCATHAARHQTRRLSARLVSALLGLSLAASLPLLLPELDRLPCLAIVLLGASLPLVPTFLFRKVPEGHAARGKAVFFDRDSELVCLRPSYARKLGDEIGVPLTEVPARDRVPFELGVPLGCALFAAYLHAHGHPALRVINANTESIEVLIDGKTLGSIEPSGGESPTAGVSTRVPAGSRRLRAVSASGQVLADTRVNALAGKHHLFAPGAKESCFWLERATYGRAGRDFEHIPLEPAGERFWVVPDSVKGWFVPLPPSEEST